MDNISSEWTEEERLIVIAELSLRQLEARRQLRGQREALQLAETILYLATEPASFLEANRRQILEDAGMLEQGA